MLILVVDDEKELRDALKSTLEYEGYDVITAENGLVGFMLAREKKPDLILLDISMPVMDGFTALFKLKQDPATKDIPVIILTGQYVDEENLERGFNLGAAEYLYKPFRPTELIARVRSILRMRAFELESKKIELMTEKFFINELRKIFTSIKGVIELLIAEEGIGSELKEILLDNYQKINKWFVLGEYFVKLSDISAGIDKMEISIFDINLLIKSVSAEIKEKFNNIEFEINSVDGAYVKGNQNWLKIGFEVLFETMAEAMGSRGKIYINQSLRSSGGEKFVFVSVRDEVKKMPDEITKLLFSPHLLLDYEYKPDYDLLAVKIFQRTVELNGGSVIVEPSESQKGNKFVIRLHSI
jgi:DNA-binding response OmpR family regulator